MLCILRLISQYCDIQEPILDVFADFKIVYVAPMKALVAEIVEKLGKRLKWLGIRVRELTGNT